MSAESPAPSNSTSGVEPPRNAAEEFLKHSSNSEPPREDQVQNAVKFLSHPKVRGSPVVHRRSFLEKKGLTKDEIDEAFRRVPPDSTSSVQTAGVSQDGQLKPSSDIQQQGQPQALQPTVPPSNGVTSSTGTLSRHCFHWSHALIAVGLLAASGAGTVLLIKNSVLPWLKSWIRNVVLEEEYDQLKRTGSKPTLAEEAAQAAKEAAAAATDMAQASQELLSSKTEEKRYFAEVVSRLDKQVQEMKLMTNALKKLEVSSGLYVSKQEHHQVTQTSSKIQQLIVNGKSDFDSQSVRSSSPSASVEPSSAPHPKSYMEIMAMIQRGERPSNIRDIDDSAPDPHQQPSNPRLAPRAKPWEVSQVQSTSTQVYQSQVNGKDLNSKIQDNVDNPGPWWRTKNVSIKEIDSEIEYNGAPAASSQQPIQRMWVPPQPPPITMPEAAEAIKRRKALVQKEVIPDDQSVAHSSDMSNGLKSEGALEGSSVNSLVSSGLIEDHEAN
ncbi:hypothetical protein RJT34_01191 [Clitoria ternatea]|uniref:Peroxisomal membrane protein PEX14 n=1 Tax=Clitoria ternatea TaxID=43366 RepID=A0AAN9KJ37_CLITE